MLKQNVIIKSFSCNASLASGMCAAYTIKINQVWLKGYLHYKTIFCRNVTLDAQLILLFEEKIMFRYRDILIFVFL